MSSLRNKTVVVTRPPHQSGSLVRRLEDAGARALLFPVIEAAEPAEPSLLDEAVRSATAQDFDVLVFTSANAVEAFASRLAGLPPVQGSVGRLVAVGPATKARLEELNLGNVLVPHNYTGVDAAGALGAGSGRLLLLQGDKATPSTAAAFSANGWDVTAVAAYRIERAEPDLKALEQVRTGRFDAVTFTSGSSVSAFVELIGDPHAIGLGPSGPGKVVCMGASALGRAGSVGMAVAAVASENTIDALVHAIEVALEGQ